LDRRTDKAIREVTGTCDLLPRPAFSPDGKLIAANGRGVVRIWDITTGNERFRSGNYDLLDSGFVSFSPDGRFLLASAGPGHTSLHRLGESAAVSKLAISGGLAAAAFSPDMQWIAVGTWSQMRLNGSADSGPHLTPVAGQRAVIAVYEVATGRQIFSKAVGDWATALAFSEDGRMLLAACGDISQPGKVLALDGSSGRIVRTVVERVDAQNWSAFSPDRAWLAAISHSPPGSVRKALEAELTLSVLS
jgi:WD40 repeat protein